MAELESLLVDTSNFNEAAGIPRGRQIHRVKTMDLLATSMRPRVFPAEDTSASSASMRTRLLQ